MAEACAHRWHRGGGDGFRRHGEEGGRRRPAMVEGRRLARVEEEKRKRLGFVWLIPHFGPPFPI
jgi:hypothetical protein